MHRRDWFVYTGSVLRCRVRAGIMNQVSRIAACVAGVLLCGPMLRAQQCVTQSQMQPADKAALTDVADKLAREMQGNDATDIRALTLPEYAKDFTGMANTIANTAPHLANATFAPSTFWILDASHPANGSDGSAQDTQFFCNLNKSTAETSFLIRNLPQGRYALVVEDSQKPGDPWQLAYLLRQSSAGAWQLAGLFPRATTASGHDGLWYWRAARAAAASRQNWTAWVDYQEAQQLLKPVGFVSSSHLEQLRDEEAKATPSALSSGISVDTPLIVKGKDGVEYRVTGLGPDASLGADRIDVAMHFTADPIADPAAGRARNRAAASALLNAYPDLRDHFHGVWVFAESPNTPPFATEDAMAQLP